MKYFLFFVFICNMTFSQSISWYIIHPIKKDTIFLGEKGTVQEALIKIGELPDPFYGENEKKFNWIENYDWTFYGRINISEQQFYHDFIELEFPSIDTYAKITIDKNLIAETKNAFHTHRFEVKKHLKIGENFIKIVFTSPINYHRANYEKRKSKLPAPNDVGEIDVASMSRKPQYQFGWDWALRMNTIGFWKPVKIHCYNTNKIENIKIETKNCDLSKADLELSIRFTNCESGNYQLKSKLFGNFESEISKEKILRLPLVLKSPRLWWPNGHGEAFLYEDSIAIFDKENNLIDAKKVRFGVRRTELIQEKDQWGTSFYFKINGEKIFVKGANYIPQDVFPSKVEDESIKQLIQDCKNSNFNTLRVWGGGYYPDDIFYETCDELGIMIWQDFMFACAMYPGDTEFLNNVEIELSEQIQRISAHPSLIYFNGNNEVDVAWKNWGFQLRYKIGPKKQKEIEKDYVELFKNLAPKLVKKYCFVPYEHTSPLSNWGKDEYFNHGTMHYWGVWHGKDPLEDFGNKTGRFNAEYGFQSFPEFSTLKQISEEKDWDLNSAIMKHHQKSYVGNGMIKKHSDILFGETNDFKRFIYYSQLTQSRAVSVAIAGHRSDQPRCMGTLYWQLNDCWQAPTWSSIDYNKNWKALQYIVKKDFEPLAIIQRTQKIGYEKYFITSDLKDSFDREIKYVVYNLKGEVLFKNIEKINIDGVWLQEIAQITQQENFLNSDYFIEFEWENHDKKLLKRSFFHPSKNYKSSENTKVELKLQNIDLINKSAELILENKDFLADCWIYSSKLGVKFSENFESYLPGSHHIVIKFEEIPKMDDFGLIYR